MYNTARVRSNDDAVPLSAERKLARLKFSCGKKTGEIIIDRSTHLGRVPYPTHQSPRDLPDVFKQAKVAVVIEEGDALVSRNHALVMAAGSLFFIHDLNSLNGTYLNGERIARGGARLLSDGDRISLSDKTNLVFTTSAEVQNSALLVGCPAPAPGILDRLVRREGVRPRRSVRNDLRAMAEALGKREHFDNNIAQLYDRGATREAVINALRFSASLASEDSVSVIYFTAHGSRRGIMLSDGVLGPAELYSALKDIRGKKVVLLDCCHASIFLKNVPPGTLLITGESPKGFLYEGLATQCIDFAPESGVRQGWGMQFQGYLTRSFLNVLESCPEAIDLKRIADKLRGYHRLVKQEVEVFEHGTTVFLDSVLSHLRNDEESDSS